MCIYNIYKYIYTKTSKYIWINRWHTLQIDNVEIAGKNKMAF